MEKCPDCGIEFEEQEGKCPKCNPTKDEKADWERLTTVGNDIEFGMVAGLLQMANIPVVRNVKGIDGYMQIILGMPIAGIDIYVPNDRFEEAYELINSYVEEEELEAAEEETEE